MAEISPGTYFEIDGEGVEYVGVRQDPNSEKPKVVTRLNPQNKDEALHREYSLDDVQERGKDFSRLGPELTRRNAETQYNSHLELFRRTKIIQDFNGKESFTGIDHKEYPIPSFEEIWKMMQENGDVLRPKINQGFTKLLMVPFGISTKKLTDKLKLSLLQHSSHEKLFNTGGNRLELNRRSPIDDSMYMHDHHNIFYHRYLHSYTMEEKKEDMLERTSSLPFPGWKVLLMEDMDEVPNDDKEVVKGGRRQLRRYFSFESFLDRMTRKEYEHESGMMMEDWLTFCLLNLEEKNMVADSRLQGIRLFGQTFGEYHMGSMGAAVFSPAVGWDYNFNELHVYGRVGGDSLMLARTVVSINEANNMNPGDS